MAENTVINYLSLTGLSQYNAKIKAFITDKVAEGDAKSFKFVNLEDGVLKFYTVNPITEDTVADFEIELPEQDLSNLMALVKDATKGNVASFGDNGQVVDSGVAIADIATKSEVEAVQTNVDTLTATVSKNTTAIGTMDNLSTNAKGDLVSAINEVRASVSAGGTEAAVSLDTSVTTEGYLKSYTLYQGETKIGVIDIPKELMAVSGQVIVNPEGMADGTYLELTIQNGDPVYVDVASLIENYTAASDAAQVQITIDAETREISASLVAGSVGTEELSDSSITTVKIVDGNVTKAKLSTEVQASLDKADAAATQEALDSEIGRATKAEAQVLVDAKAYADEKIGEIDLSGIDTNAADIEALETLHAQDKASLEAKDTEISNKVTTLETAIDTLQSIQHEEITEAQIDELFAVTE